jgi:YidC/Oxa1 family membrane protein insertase
MGWAAAAGSRCAAWAAAIRGPPAASTTSRPAAPTERRPPHLRLSRESDVALFNQILNPLYNAVSWVLLQFHDMWSHIFAPTSGAAWALSIVMLVVVIRIALIPLFVKQIKAQRGLQMLQPQMKAIQTKYKNDRQKQSEEMMKLYKDTGTNPLSSCLPILVQSPFFFALFHVLSYIAKGQPVGVLNQATVDQAREATIFGAPIAYSFINNDGLIQVKIVAAIMIVLMTLTTFTTQRQLMVKNQPLGQSNPMMQQQKILLYVFPGMFAVFGINFPIGVLIYWLTTNLWTMGQQFYVIRRNPTPGSAAAEALDKRRAEREAAKDVVVAETVPQEIEPKVVRQQPKRETRAKRTNPPKKTT